MISTNQPPPVDRWIVEPIRKFIGNSTASGLMLFSSALIAMIVANSPWSHDYHHLWELEFSVSWAGKAISKSLHHWINDGLMAVFFFVVGLELKREILAGELRDASKAVLPIAAAVGGMLFPAIIYLLWNGSGEASNGWGIPMATDIAFALGVLYLLGDRIPIALKVFLTALAITDDLGAVLVIAFFYTSDINFISLLTGAIFLIVLMVANRMGVRSTLFYAIVGIGGVWLAFLMSGVHATIAAVLAAFTIPANVRVSEKEFTVKLVGLLDDFRKVHPNDVPTVTTEQHHILQAVRDLSKAALTPLQRLEHALHPLVAFIIMPVFAFSNAGITVAGDMLGLLTAPVTVGVFAGLLAGKVIGVYGVVWLFVKMKWAVLPNGVTSRHMLGAGFLAGVGFTMSLFITGLAFTDPIMIMQAKIGILLASLLASLVGFLILRSTGEADPVNGI